VLLVSHDRALLDAVAGRTLAIEDATLRSYPGGWADYVDRRSEREPKPEHEPEPRPKQAPRRPERERPSRDPVEELEREIAAKEEAVATLEADLAADWANADKVAAHRRARQELQALFARWEALLEDVSAPSSGATRSPRS
jgi:ATPase subunit of ABC transporter with duplicated ATPase domains